MTDKNTLKSRKKSRLAWEELGGGGGIRFIERVEYR